ncbi:MAG: prepilin-type N-terminal cleavage/methylation domain-containing protein [Aquabacterium sp.]|nr:prepilin-type N-terminal cleavage/methylation domain-containing protein [Aquabacterium sp.]
MACAERSIAFAAHRARGFTLIELLMVLLLIALVSGMVSLSLRDGGQASLEREAQRLAALLEAGRAEARATGVAVRFELVGAGQRQDMPEQAESQFRFVGLGPASLPGSGNTAGRWLDQDIVARIDNATALRLGPEPLIGAQRIILSLDGQTRVLATDGLAPFAVAEPPAATP